ncbi:MAG TPA: type II secretion system F family protein [Pyrinomonadaceae bacterium]|jgi:tight adherence protein B|nr:type II secretion system F family protein [Pyrinomonadaceae bacterium]
MIPFLVFTACMFAVYGVYLLATRDSEAKRKRLQQRLSDVLLYTKHSDDADVQLARQELLSEIPALNRALTNMQFATRLRRMLDQADLHITVSRLVMLSLMAGILAGLAASVLTYSMLIVVGAGAAATSVPFIHVAYRRKKRLNKFLELLPDALELMSRALQAGHAFAESLHMIATEMPEPISTEFRKTYEEQNLGLSLKLALENLAERVPLLDLRLCVTAIMIQRETGGNLAEILEKVSYTIRERFRILEDLNTLTTSSRMSAWILCALPVFVALAVTIMNPDYMSVLWSDPRGHYLIAAASGMQLVGMLVIRKILKIKV